MAREKLFTDWSVQLAKTYKPGMIEDGTWFSISQKINGARATFFAGNLVSRSGHEYLGFDDIIANLEKLNTLLEKGYAFDGELRLKNEFCKGLTDNEAFKRGTGIANTELDFRNKHMMQFVIFDIIEYHQFAYSNCNMTYKNRLQYLRLVEELIDKYNLEGLCVVPVFYTGTDISQIDTLLDTCTAQGMEGIMINLDGNYCYNRTGSILKYKKFNTVELPIIGFTAGTGKYEGTLGAILVKYNENVVGVGTGMNDMQRKWIWEHKNQLINKVIEVKYKDITADAITGLPSLQFPVFVCFRWDKEINSLDQ